MPRRIDQHDKRLITASSQVWEEAWTASERRRNPGYVPNAREAPGTAESLRQAVVAAATAPRAMTLSGALGRARSLAIALRFAPAAVHMAKFADTLGDDLLGLVDGVGTAGARQPIGAAKLDLPERGDPQEESREQALIEALAALRTNHAEVQQRDHNGWTREQESEVDGPLLRRHQAAVAITNAPPATTMRGLAALAEAATIMRDAEGGMDPTSGLFLPLAIKLAADVQAATGPAA